MSAVGQVPALALANARDAERYRKLQALDYYEACRILQYRKPEGDRILDQYIEQFGPEPVAEEVQS